MKYLEPISEKIIGYRLKSVSENQPELHRNNLKSINYRPTNSNNPTIL